MIVGQAVVDGILTGGVYALMAAGLTLTFGVMQVINVAQGALVVLGAYLSYELEQHAQIDPFVGLLVTVPALFLLGVGIEMLLIRRLRTLSIFNFVVMAILATYAVSVITEGVLDMIFGSGLVEVQAPYVDNSFVWFGMHLPEIYVYGFLLAAGLLGALSLLLYRTRFGRSVRATEQNRTSAMLVGVPVHRVSTIVFGIGVAVTAAGGMIFGATNAFNGDSGSDLISRLLTIVVLGGLGSMGGALVGAIVLLVVENLVAVLWSPDWAPLVFSVVLVVVLLVRPNGLLGRAVAT
ncbi:MAG TPA: branched-chain amino acid ABC transporter permease [Trebonia sp.]|nr:branched-chain amino acid ABC transporter permease [Trebonia sp.]